MLHPWGDKCMATRHCSHKLRKSCSVIYQLPCKVMPRLFACEGGRAKRLTDHHHALPHRHRTASRIFGPGVCMKIIQRPLNGRRTNICTIWLKITPKLHAKNATQAAYKIGRGASRRGQFWASGVSRFLRAILA